MGQNLLATLYITVFVIGYYFGNILIVISLSNRLYDSEMAAKRDDSLQPEIGRDLCRVRTEGGKYRGYRKDILTENLSERDNAIFMCPRCKGILRELCLSAGGEQFCSCCKKEGEQTNPNIHMNNMILCFKCCCPLMVRGCVWVGTLGDCEIHLDTCGYVEEKCKLKCGDVLQRNNHVTHEKENCIQRIVKCEHCKKNFKFCELTEHLDVCPKMKVSCKLKCGIVLCRDKVTQHIDSDCTEKEVECPFVKYKCVGLIKRHNLNTHLEENETEHLKMKLNAIEDIVMKQSEIIERMSLDIISLKKKRLNPIIFYWEIPDVRSLRSQFTSEKELDANGYLIQFNLIHRYDSLLMGFCLKDGLDYDRLDWPFRAKFVVHLISPSHSVRLQRESEKIRSEVIEVGRKDFATNFIIAAIPIIPFTPLKIAYMRQAESHFELEISVIFC